MAAEYTEFNSVERRAEALAEKIRVALNKPYILAKHSYIFIGITIYSGEPLAIGGVLQQAEQAMYQSKNNSKNTSTVYAD